MTNAHHKFPDSMVTCRLFCLNNSLTNASNLQWSEAEEQQILTFERMEGAIVCRLCLTNAWNDKSIMKIVDWFYVRQLTD